jgi:lipopolysaccharide export system permease protein
MFTQIDRLLVRAYFKAYLVCLTSLLGLYVIVDLFTNLDEFTSRHHSIAGIVRHIGFYYGHHVALIFDRLCEAIVLLAGMFTIAWMQRNNELLPLLSAGVSTRRVVQPVLWSGFFMLTLAGVNQEFHIPRIAANLTNQKEDPYGDAPQPVQPMFEANGIHIHGSKALRKDQKVQEFYVTVPQGIYKNMLHLSAKEAIYIAPNSDPRSGGWLLLNTVPPDISEQLDDNRKDVLEQIDPGKFFLHTKETTFDTITRRPNWYNLSSTLDLFGELQKPESIRLAPMAVLFHMRLTRPIIGMILVLLGLSVILRDQNRNIFISAGMCVLLCGVFFAALFGCKQLGDNDVLPPALAAWLPVLLFGPLSVVMFDAVHT